MYEAFYNLSCDPFRLLPDPGICFPHQSCAKAWAYLRYAVKRGEGVVVVTGPPGSGKTTLAERLLRELNPATTVSVRLIANDLNATDLLRKLAYSFGLPAEGMDRAMLAHRIERYLVELEHANRRALVLIDEAQTLSHHALEAMRLLTDLQSRSRPVLQLILLGQEELEGVMCAPGMEQFQHRVIASCRLHTMDLAETKAYLEYRLAYADWRGDPSINGPAVMAIFRHSKGLPRHINKICSRLLLHGGTEELHALTDREVHAVVADLREELLAPLDRAAEPAIDGSSGIFDSVYELALVPQPSAGPAQAEQRPRGEALAALYLADDAPWPGDPATDEPTGQGGGRMGWHAMRDPSGGYRYRASRRRARNLRHRLAWPYRIVRQTARHGVSAIREHAPHLRERLSELQHAVGPRLRTGVRDASDWAADVAGRARVLYVQADRRQLAIAASFAGMLLVAVVLIAVNHEPAGRLPTGGGTSVALSAPPGDALIEGGFLDDSGRYLEIASVGADRLGGSLGFGHALDPDSVESLAAMLMQSQVRPAQVVRGSGGPSYLSGLDDRMSQPLLGMVTGDVTGQIIGRAAQSGTSLGVWTIARVEETVYVHGQLPHVDAPAVDGAAETAVANVQSASAAGGEGKDDEQIALVVSRDQNAALDYVRFLPAPAAGPRPSQANAAQPANDVTGSDIDGAAAVPVEPPVVRDVAQRGGSSDSPADGEPTVDDEMVVAALAVSSVPGRTADTAVLPEVQRLVGLGDDALDRDRLLLPEEGSAYTYYQSALALDAQNPAAQAGLARIVDRYRQLAAASLASGEFDRADRYVDRALRVDSGSRPMRALKKRIADAVAQAKAEAEAVAAAEEAAAQAAAFAAAERARQEAEAERAAQEAAQRNKLTSFQRLMRFVNGYGVESGN